MSWKGCQCGLFFCCYELYKLAGFLLFILSAAGKRTGNTLSENKPACAPLIVGWQTGKQGGMSEVD